MDRAPKIIVTNELDAPLTALYVKIDDEIRGARSSGRPPQLTDSELITLAVAQALPRSRAGCGSCTRGWERFNDSDSRTAATAIRSRLNASQPPEGNSSSP